MLVCQVTSRLQISYLPLLISEVWRHLNMMAEMSLKRFKRGHNFNDIRSRLIKFKSELTPSLGKLKNKKEIFFCFVKILNCNGGYPCNFSKAWCVTQRNLDDKDERKQKVVLFTELFNIDVVNEFIENVDTIETKLTDSQLTAFNRLVSFLENLEEITKCIKNSGNPKLMNETEWTSVLGIHILRQLAVSTDIRIDSDYIQESTKCPCGCQTIFPTRDNSIGHKDVWHGSLDIIVGPVAVQTHASLPDEHSDNESSTEFEDNTWDLEESRNQIIAQSIVFSFVQKAGLIPTIGLSKDRELKVFMYHPEFDLLYESTGMPLFDTKGKFITTTVLVLWFVLNHADFCTGVKDSHECFGYVADFKSIIPRPLVGVYENQVHRGGCKHAENTAWKLCAHLYGDQYTPLGSE